MDLRDLDRRAGGPRPVLAIGAAWILSLAFDLFLHAGALARLYTRPNPALLGPMDAFRRIPVGYATFLVLTWCLYWLLRRLDVRGARAGIRFGMVAGLVVWGGLCAGLWSITTLEWDLLLGWWLGQAAELALAGAVAGAVLGGASTRSVVIKVTVAVFLLLAVTVALQVAGLAPAMETMPVG